MSQTCYMTYQLEDPREPDIPVFIGYGTGPAPWQTLWDFRHYGTGPLFDWFRELDTIGRRPVVAGDWGIGRVTRIERVAARLLVRFRVEQICRWGAGQWLEGPKYPEHPPFLLNSRFGTPDSRRRVEAAKPGGETMAFASVGHAVKQGFSRSGIYRALKTGGTHRGLRWRYADGGQSGRIRHPVERIRADGQVTRYGSIYEAAKVSGVARPTIARLIETSEPDSNSCRWRLATRLDI